MFGTNSCPVDGGSSCSSPSCLATCDSDVSMSYDVLQSLSTLKMACDTGRDREKVCETCDGHELICRPHGRSILCFIAQGTLRSLVEPLANKFDIKGLSLSMNERKITDYSSTSRKVWAELNKVRPVSQVFDLFETLHPPSIFGGYTHWTQCGIRANLAEP